MKIFKIEIENYRLLKSFSLDLENELSLVIGKNNTGKTSILLAIDKFINHSEKTRFSFDDFNIEFKKELEAIIIDPNIKPEVDYKHLGIKLKLFINYNETDNLSNIGLVMMDLDPLNNVIVLGYEYILTFQNYLQLRKEYSEFLIHEGTKKNDDRNYIIKSIYHFLHINHSKFFIPSKKTFEYDRIAKKVNENNFISLINEDKDIINFKYISAKRDVSNKEVDTTLSNQTSRIYNGTEASDEQNKFVEQFKDRLSETDSQLSEIYKSLFASIINKVKVFGGIRINESEIDIISTLQHRELLQGNTTVVYKHDSDNLLPEHYNGLGYLNLISIIFEIEILVNDFKGDKNKNPSDINLLFIEEPEAHTHPQMQYIFIKNIKELLKEEIKLGINGNLNLQYIISTHSAHIVADSDFNDIKYLKRTGLNSVIAKNLKDLEREYIIDGQEQNYRFLKQYLTLNRAELFFAEKAIFIEGDTERILLPAMMRKLDYEFPDNPLLSQNISIVEVGAHSQIFEKFIDFIGLAKSLIITDIDSYYLEAEYEKDGVTQKTYVTTGNPVFSSEKCSASDPRAKYTSNTSLHYFHNGVKEIDYFKKLSLNWQILRKNKKRKWVSNRKGPLLVAFQKEENGYHARSFEDSFFHLNKNFIIDANNPFPSLTDKYLTKLRDGTIDSFGFSEKAINSKPSLAIEILLNSKADINGLEFANWKIPSYINEGLLWLKQE